MTTNKNINKTAVIYLRVSTKDQAEKGGTGEGFSIPAQREACHKKADDLKAQVVEQFVDRGESARSSDRAELQRMLNFVADNRTDYLIVHKVDRLARNRADDVEINLALQNAGTTLVSCTESIDETPSGMLLHGIMSSIAEFYSRNLGNEVKKGSLQKVKSGGTVGRAPIGYLNVGEVSASGREVRTIKIDSDRAPHIKWAFETYATGNYSIVELLTMLEARGLMSRPHKRTAPVKPLVKSQLARILRNPYYTGKVQYKGAVYSGNHEALISQELFDTVQDLLTAKNNGGNRKRIHDHHLKGMLTCGHCDTPMFLSLHMNRHGTKYPYFLCRGRKEGKCELSYVHADRIGAKLNEYYKDHMGITDQQAQTLRELLQAEIEQEEVLDQKLLKQANASVKKVDEKRKKLLRLYYEDDISRELFKQEQATLDAEERKARDQIAKSETELTDVMQVVEQCLFILSSWPDEFTQASAKQRREFNNIFFETIYVFEDGHIEPKAQSHLSALQEVAQTLESHETPHTPQQTINTATEDEGGSEGSTEIRVEKIDSLLATREINRNKDYKTLLDTGEETNNPEPEWLGVDTWSFWHAWRDLNPQPTGSKPATLSN